MDSSSNRKKNSRNILNPIFFLRLFKVISCCLTSKEYFYDLSIIWNLIAQVVFILCILLSCLGELLLTFQLGNEISFFTKTFIETYSSRDFRPFIPVVLRNLFVLPFFFDYFVNVFMFLTIFSKFLDDAHSNSNNIPSIHNSSSRNYLEIPPHIKPARTILLQKNHVLLCKRH